MIFLIQGLIGLEMDQIFRPVVQQIFSYFGIRGLGDLFVNAHYPSGSAPRLSTPLIYCQYNKSIIIVEQAFSSIRTVYSFVGEAKYMTNFSSALDATVKIGLKQGLEKGISIGGNGSASFALWEFISWYGNTLAMNHGVSSGKIFGVGYCIILGGL
jgi:hypothetical protein